jgi:hypothetical protein
MSLKNKKRFVLKPSHLVRFSRRARVRVKYARTILCQHFFSSNLVGPLTLKISVFDVFANSVVDLAELDNLFLTCWPLRNPLAETRISHTLRSQAVVNTRDLLPRVLRDISPKLLGVGRL